jgi:SOS-response transcriptional repressor LexA
MKGCYVCFLDKDTERFFRSRIETTEQFRAKQPPPVGRDVRVEQQQAPLPPKNTNGIQKLANSLPIYSLKAAAGKFLENQDIHEEGWIEVDMGRKLDEKMFVARVVGDSMEPDIPNGSYCIFRAEPVGSRQGKIVLVCHQDIHDVDNGGAYTVKKYWSKKAFEPDGTWRHEKIVLESLNKAYEPIIIAGASGEEFRIVAEFLCVLKP